MKKEDRKKIERRNHMAKI